MDPGNPGPLGGRSHETNLERTDPGATLGQSHSGVANCAWGTRPPERIARRPWGYLLRTGRWNWIVPQWDAVALRHHRGNQLPLVAQLGRGDHIEPIDLYDLSAVDHSRLCVHHHARQSGVDLAYVG